MMKWIAPTIRRALAVSSVAIPPLIRDASGLAGAGLISYGAWLVTPAAGFITVFPCDSAQPLASNLNFVPGLTVPNAVITKLAADGTVCLYTNAPTHLIVDVNGYFE